jgi:hypothetical protein
MTLDPRIIMPSQRVVHPVNALKLTAQELTDLESTTQNKPTASSTQSRSARTKGKGSLLWMLREGWYLTKEQLELLLLESLTKVQRNECLRRFQEFRVYSVLSSEGIYTPANPTVLDELHFLLFKFSKGESLAAKELRLLLISNALTDEQREECYQHLRMQKVRYLLRKLNTGMHLTIEQLEFLLDECSEFTELTEKREECLQRLKTEKARKAHAAHWKGRGDFRRERDKDRKQVPD